jgi:periplasmic protein TonB
MAGPAFFAEPSRASAYPSFVWEVPGKPVVVRIALDLVDRLEAEVLESFRSLTSRGSEIGGLLLGTVHGNSPFEVAIQDYETVPCDYSRGPLYRLSPPDLERLERVLEQRAGSGMRVAGFFRSHTRKGLSLDADDVAIFNRLFPNMYQVALLAKPFATKPALGGVFIREEGSLRTESSYKEFPFRKSELERAGASVATLKGGEKTASPTAAAPRAEQPPARATSRAQIVPIASRREVAAPPVQSVVPEPAAEVAAAPVHAPGSDLISAAVPAETAAAAAQMAPVRSEPLTETQPVAEPDRKAAARPVTESADWVDTFDFEKLLREGQEKAQSTGALHRKPLPEFASALAETAAPAPVVRGLQEPIAAAGPEPAAVTMREPAFAALDDTGFLKLRSPRLMWIAGGSAAALIILSGLLVFPGLHRTKRPASVSSSDASTMSLRVERSAGELLLTWNRDSDAIRGATHAVLAIADGERHENVDLDLAQLRNGSIVYSPSSSDIVFQLTVTGKNSAQTQSESVRVLRTRPSPMPDPPSPSKPVPTRPTGANAQPPAPSAGVDEAGEQARSTDVPLRPFQPDTLALRLRAPRPSDLPDAPGLNSGGQPIPAVSLPLNPAAPVLPQAPAPPVQVAAPPPVPQQPRVGGQVREAQILNQTTPEYPLAARQARVQGSVVILAVVGADGHIKSAKALSGPPLLQNPAAAAVRQWMYKPATLNGIPVESETRIELNFTLQR